MLDVQDEVGLLAAVVHTGREGAPAALFALGLGETGLAIRGGLDVREAKAIRNSPFTARRRGGSQQLGRELLANPNRNNLFDACRGWATMHGADSTGCRRSSNRESRESNQQVRFEYHVVPQPDTVDAALRAADAAEERRPPRYHQKGRRRPTPRRPPTESDTSSPLDA